MEAQYMRGKNRDKILFCASVCPILGEVVKGQSKERVLLGVKRTPQQRY